ncbi:hypothetical protein [Micromonospora sp. NPDC003776]
MAIDSSEFETCRRLFTYRAGIWLYRLEILSAVLTLPLRAAGVRLMPPRGAALTAAVHVILYVAAYRLVFRSFKRDGYDPLRPPGGLVVRDVFRLTYW